MRTLGDIAQGWLHLAGLIDRPIATVRVTAGVEAVNVRRLTLQVVDRTNAVFPGRWLIAVYFATAADADPSGTQTVAVVTGYTWGTIAANQAYEFLTDADGVVVLDVTQAGAASRVVATAVRGQVAQTGAIAWAA